MWAAHIKNLQQFFFLLFLFTVHIKWPWSSNGLEQCTLRIPYHDHIIIVAHYTHWSLPFLQIFSWSSFFFFDCSVFFSLSFNFFLFFWYTLFFVHPFFVLFTLYCCCLIYFHSFLLCVFSVPCFILSISIWILNFSTIGDRWVGKQFSISFVYRFSFFTLFFYFIFFFSLSFCYKFIVILWIIYFI